MHTPSQASRHPPPTSLKIVSALFIFFGISALIEVITAMFLRGHTNLNFGVLGIFIGRGLLRYSRGWRTCALVFMWMSLISAPVAALVFIVSGRPLDLKILGEKVGTTHQALGLLLVAGLFALTLWQYRVLTRPDIRKLFGLPAAG